MGENFANYVCGLIYRIYKNLQKANIRTPIFQSKPGGKKAGKNGKTKHKETIETNRMQVW